MLTDNLFETILLNPARERADTLYIVSGYASATMVSRHLEALEKLPRTIHIQLIVGMTFQDGISAQDHQGFKHLASTSNPYQTRFSCRYVAYERSVHAKIYSWSDGGSPVIAFAGSANYTQSAFQMPLREAMVPCDAEDAREFFDLTLPNTIDCSDSYVDKRIAIHRVSGHLTREAESTTETSIQRRPLSDHVKSASVRVSLLQANGKMHTRAGLNWGQRPEENRDPNQAYIPLQKSIRESDFFPPRGQHFMILTDDDKQFFAVRAQDGAKAIHTPDNNSRLGEYFRYRLGKSWGSFVKKDDLEDYGRTHVDFYKIDEETYLMDFSV